MSEHPAAPGLVRAAWGDFRRAWAPLVVFEFAFKLFQAWLVVPAVAAVLSRILARTGRVAVSNWDLLDFVQTPAGILYAGLLATTAVALLLFEQAGIMAVAATGGRVSVPRALGAAVRRVPRIAGLGAIQVVLLAVALVPFVLLVVLTHAALLTGHDLYFYLKDRPTVFWVAAGIGGVVLAAAALVGTFLYVRWAFALPILLFEGGSAAAALRASRDRTRGVRWRVGGVLVGWQVGAAIAGAALMGGFRLIAARVLDGGGELPITRILFLLTIQGVLLVGWSIVTVVGLSLLTRRLYLARTEHLGLLRPGGGETESGSGSPWPRRLALVAAVLALLGPLAIGYELITAPPPRPVRVTAHRGHARAAPENTLSAIRKAIESGADYAEIDV